MKITIYTVITGGYDSLRQPVVVDDRFSYICFSNDFTEDRIGVWEIRKIPAVIEDLQRLSRYPKLKPHELLSENDYSVYMDANLVIAHTDFYSRIMYLAAQNTILAGVKNGWRSCLYDEGFRCVLSRLDSIPKIIREMRFIKSEGFPRQFGMYEANIIFRSHHHNIVKKQSELWWNMVLNNAKRDQLCFSYTMWKYGIPWCYIFPDGSNTHNNSSIIFHEHPHKLSIDQRFVFRKMLKSLKPLAYLIYQVVISIGTKK